MGCCCFGRHFSFLLWIHWIWTQLPCEEAQFRGLQLQRGMGQEGKCYQGAEEKAITQWVLAVSRCMHDMGGKTENIDLEHGCSQNIAL